jgi:hypothetical protein
MENKIKNSGSKFMFHIIIPNDEYSHFTVVDELNSTPCR